MKRTLSFISFLTVLSLMAGWLFSKVSFVGRVGMSLFYQNYNFFKIWWKGALLVYFTLLILFAVQASVQKYASSRTSTIIHIVALIIAVAGIYFTYQDFRHTLSHRWAGERFHLGFYCFWLGWMGISLFFLTRKSAPEGN
jgi:hypothetical protein